MDQRIRDFAPLWNALDHLALLPRTQLVRSTCEHWTLPEAELARWFAAPTVAERDAILAANRTPHRFSWNEAPDEEEIRLNKELHFGYETYGQDGPAPLQEFEQPQAGWLQRTTGQRDVPFQAVQDPDGFPAPLIVPLPAQALDQDDIDEYFRSSFD